jgi:bla regulator protein BlaR1
MIDLLIALIMPLTLVLAVLLTVHAPMLEKWGANSVYWLWLVVPASLLLYLLPLDWLKTAGFFGGGNGVNGEVAHFIVNSTEAIKSGFNIDWLVFIWLSVSLSAIGYLSVSHLFFVRGLNIQACDWFDQDGLLPDPLALYQSTHTHSPMLVGLFKQKLIIPEDFADLYNPEQQRLILAHEICHFDRNDIYWNFMAFSLLALFWFHPLVWLAYFRFRRDQELSCDQTVLARKHLNSRINYSKALLVSAQTAPPMAFAQLSFKKYGDKEIMFERIKHIKTNAKTSGLSMASVSMLAIALLSSISYAGSLTSADHQLTKPAHKAEPITRVEPEYPSFAAQEKMSGAVLLKFDIKPNGHTDNITVLKSKPEGIFDNVALTALSHWVYQAHEQDMLADNVVQLDFLFDKDSKRVSLVEGIKINH